MTVASTWKSLPPWAKGLVAIAILVALYFALWKPLKRFIEKERAKARSKKYESNGSGFNPAIVAAQIYDAVYNNDWFGFSEDEERIKEVLLSIPSGHINDVAQAYQELYNKVLQEDVVAALGDDEWNAVKQLFN